VQMDNEWRTVQSELIRKLDVAELKAKDKMESLMSGLRSSHRKADRAVENVSILKGAI